MLSWRQYLPLPALLRFLVVLMTNGKSCLPNGWEWVLELKLGVSLRSLVSTRIELVTVRVGEWSITALFRCYNECKSRACKMDLLCSPSKKNKVVEGCLRNRTSPRMNKNLQTVSLALKREFHAESFLLRSWRFRFRTCWLTNWFSSEIPFWSLVIIGGQHRRDDK